MYLQPTRVPGVLLGAPMELKLKPTLSQVNRVRQSLSRGLLTMMGCLIVWRMKFLSDL